MIDAGPQKGLSLSSPFLMEERPKMKVELDRKALFALASDSRIEILKELQAQRRTVTQLADSLDIDKGAIHRHLKKLEEGGLVTRYEDHGFVYYGLSWKARDLIAPGENTKIVITFALSLLLVIGAVWAFVVSFAGGAFQSGEGAPAPMASNASSPEMTGWFVSWDWFIVAVILVAVALLLFYLGTRRAKRPKQRGAVANGENDIPYNGHDED